MPLANTNLCLLPPQDLLSSYQLSQPVAIEVHQALAQLQQTLSFEESLQAHTINAALQKLTSVEVIPLEEKFSTGTKLKYRQVQEFDRYMEVRHVKAKEPASLIFASLLKAYLGFLEIIPGLTFNQNKAFVKSGFKTYTLLLRRTFGLNEYSDNYLNGIQDDIATCRGTAPPELYECADSNPNLNIEPYLTLSPLQIWKKVHWVFFVFSQGLIICLNRLIAAIGNDQVDKAKVEFKTAAELMYASGAAMKLTGDLIRNKYESEIRPTMAIGNPLSLVHSENLSGLMMWDHDYLINVICNQKLLPIMKTLPSTLSVEHEKFVLAYKCGLSDGHNSICAEFVGGGVGSLIAASESSSAIKNLNKFENSRAKILDPMHRVKCDCSSFSNGRI